LRRADRLFDILQILRVAPQPMTAAAIAEQQEVTERTIYRDIASLQASRMPIEGARGIGYVLRKGFDLHRPLRTSDRTRMRCTSRSLIVTQPTATAIRD
jgi:predicted DNA-binding transcriptional regulator YafY